MSGTPRRRPYAANLALARRIRAAGVPIHIEEDDEKSVRTSSPTLLIERFGGVTESQAFDLYGGAGLICWLTITALRPRTAIAAFGLELPWTKSVQWLNPTLRGGVLVYQFGDSLEFGEDQVLNRYADLQLPPLESGTTIQGCLLGITTKGIPDDVVHGAFIPAMLTVMDQYRRKSVAPVAFWADRSRKNFGLNPLKRTRKPLFECRDPVPVGHAKVRTF